MLILIGYIHLAPSDVAAFSADVRAASAITRAEEGCLFHSISLDDPQAGRMLLVQRWLDQACLDAHLATAAATAFLTRWQGRLAIDVQRYTATDGVALMH